MDSGGDVRLLGWPAPDGTFRARAFRGYGKVWECTHPHATIEAAWECGRERSRQGVPSSTGTADDEGPAGVREEPAVEVVMEVSHRAAGLAARLGTGPPAAV